MTQISVLKVTNLSSGYGGSDVIIDVSLEVFENEIVGISGPNACGKTTLFRAISGLIPKTSGSVTFDGRDISRMPAFQIARLGISHVPQDNCLFPYMTVRDHLKLGIRCSGRCKTLNTVLDRVSIIFPRLASLLYKKVSRLSGGEQKAVAISRAIASVPHVLLLDEPSASLDDEWLEGLGRALQEKLLGTRCTLIIEQNLEFLKQVACRRIALAGGRII